MNNISAKMVKELRDRTAVIKFLNDELKDQETVSIKELFSFYTSL